MNSGNRDSSARDGHDHRRNQHNRRNQRGATLGALVAAVLLSIVSCGTSPDIAEEDLPRIASGPESGSAITDPRVPLTLDPGILDGTLVEEVRIMAYQGETVAAEYRVSPVQPDLSFELPLRGLEDGEEYRFVFFLVMRNGDEYPTASDLILRIDLGVPVPIVASERRETFDPQPTLEWTLPPGAVAAVTQVELYDPDGTTVRGRWAAIDIAGPYPIPEQVVGREEITAATELSWRVRLENAAGVLGGWSERGRILFTENIAPPRAITAHSGGPSIVQRPALTWVALSGAVRYTVEVGTAPASTAPAATSTRADTTPPQATTQPAATARPDAITAPAARATDATASPAVRATPAEPTDAINAGDPAADLLVEPGFSRETTARTIRLDSGTITALLGDSQAGENTPIAWRVAAENVFGHRTQLSEWFTFRYEPLLPAMTTVLPATTAVRAANGGPTAAATEVVLGAENAPEADERPIRRIPLTHGYAMGRYEITTEVAAAVFDAALAAGRVAIVTTEDGDRFLVDTVYRYPLLGLDALDFGRQFSIVRTAEDRLAPAPGYRSHPAVGISWYGAVVLANELSLLEGREQVYTFRYAAVVAEAVAEHDAATANEIATTTETATENDDATEPAAPFIPGVTVDVERDGFRLPTEAEWAFAAGLQARIDAATLAEAAQSGETISVIGARSVGPVELRGTNYQRSADRWEDVNPPYTAAGGPTVPVGALGYINAAGIADLLGNVWEWTGDWYDPQWYARENDPADPAAFLGPTEPVTDVYGRSLRVLRGGAWNTPQNDVRRGSRGTFSPDGASHSIGVRLVRTLPPAPAPASRNN